MTDVKPWRRRILPIVIAGIFLLGAVALLAGYPLEDVAACITRAISLILLTPGG